MTLKYLFCLTLLGCTSAFHSAGPLPRRASLCFASLQEPEVVTYFEDLERAVQCAEVFGLCPVDELHDLADKVDAGSDSCMWEVGDDLCEKEIDDRKDVADVLRMQATLRLRMEYLDRANLFADNVKTEHDIRERDMEMEILGEDGI